MMYIYKKWFQSTALVSGLMFASANLQPAFAEGAAQLNLKGVEISTLIETVSRITGKNFIIDPRIKGTVTVITGRKMNEDELYNTFLSVLEVHGYSVVEIGGIYKVVMSNMAKQETHPIITDTTSEPPEKLVTKLVPVEHVSALSIVSALRPLSRNVQIQHHAESNSVVMSGRAEDLSRLEVVIQRMDRADEKQIEVIPLKYADANKVVQSIQALNQTGVKGAIQANDTKVSADERTNSLLVTGDKATRDRVRMIASKLDVPKKQEGNTKVIYLRYAKATDLVSVLQGVSKTKTISNQEGKAEIAQNPGGTSGGGSNLDIQADESSNSLIITADPEVVANLEKVVRQLDVRRAQVMIETIVAEVSTSLTATLGIQFGFNGLAGDSAGPVGVSTFSGAGSNNLINIATIAAGGSLGSIAPGALLGVGGESGGTQFVALLDALASDGATNILSTPTLVTMDNEEAEIVVGQNIPLITGSYSSTGTSTSPTNPFQTIERKDVGLTLKVTPQINEGTSVKLAISQEVSSLAASNASAADLITNKRSITTNVMVEDGAVLVLGGLIENTFRDNQEKVPVLGDLPVVGKMFRHDSTTKDKQNLMVFIHPVILRDHLSASDYTRQKYSAIQDKQKSSEILRRGSFKNRATQLPEMNKVITQKPFTDSAPAVQAQPAPVRKATVPVRRSPQQSNSSYIPFIDDYN